MTEYHALNLGAGVQSTALFLLAREHDPKVRFDLAVFADTGEEPTAVDTHLEYLRALGRPAVWVRSAFQIGATRSKPLDDNTFEAELATYEKSRSHIHRVGTRLVFKHDENLRTKRLAHAKNDKLFPDGEDTDHLAKEVRSVIKGPEHVSQGPVSGAEREIVRRDRGLAGLDNVLSGSARDFWAHSEKVVTPGETAKASAVGVLDMAKPDGQRPRLFDAEARTPTSAAFSPDGTRLAVGYTDGTAMVWQVK